ncbi:acetyltransferase [Loktanella sp. 3ANDIMAR09]|uniref:GNAT family N-acetyltransferase n=1 Tax=Loktanella sp. 3ANDIMAR09 TaxID=1225657 RepID=UPI0006F2F003|nr:N-acetyltransferase [Loktanella sp. 3ANDIMAR09]KQI69369.1 acetyltransferase [Loktanella sp. 3ANDIMAR09]
MEFHLGHPGRAQEIRDLFAATFAASEGADEGALIGAFVARMMRETADADLFVWSACDDGELLGCIFLSRLTYPQDDRTAFILSPVAVRTDLQGRSIGQKLIAHGLDDLRRRGVDFMMTYGDPNYYVKTGFTPITEDFAKAPLPLSFPEGWLGQSLTVADQKPLVGPSSCVAALNNPDLW